MKNLIQKITFAAAVLLVVVAGTQKASAQRVKKAEYTSDQLNNSSVSKITWTTTTIDSRFDVTENDNLSTPAIIARYKPEVDKYSDPIGFCPKGLLKSGNGNLLRSWAVDAYMEFAQHYIDTTSNKDIDKNIKIDFALMNSGGMRTDMPKGNVSKYDILSIFPFDNYLVIEEMDGDKVRMLMELFAKTKPQPMSNVKLHIDGNQVKECLIGGQPLDESRKYVVATIDFLYSGGDNLYPLKYSNWMVDTHKKLMDIFMEYIQSLTRQGRNIEKQADDRLIVENKSKEN